MSVPIRGKINIKDLLGLKPGIIEGLKDAIAFEITLEVGPDGKGNFVKLIPSIHDKWTDGLNVGDISKIPGLEKYIIESQEEHGIMNQSELITALVKMADKFDCDGDFELAEEIDRNLKSLATRPNASLKSLDDDVKKNLIIFLHKADNNIKDAMKGLTEFFRRLRYFDVVDMIKDMNLDRVVSDMSKTQQSLDSATKRFYEITHGKKPSKIDLAKYLEEDQDCKDCNSKEDPLSFFYSQEDQADDNVLENETLFNADDGEEEDDDQIEIDVELEIDKDDLEDALEKFWADNE